MRKLSILAGMVVIAVVALGVSLVTSIAQPAPAGHVSAAAPSTSLQGAPSIQTVSGQNPGISVSGEGSITVKPDIAKVTLGIEVTNSSANAAQQDAASKMDAVVSDVKKQGIQDKDIQTVRFDLSPDYDYSTKTPVLKGYRVTNLVVVTLRDISKVGSLLDSVVASGATRLQGISFGTSDPAAAGTQGREEAMKNAMAKADQLAKLAGVTLGAPISIQETVSAPPTSVDIQPKVAAAPSMATPAQTPINPGTQEIRTVVNVTYAIK